MNYEDQIRQISKQSGIKVNEKDYIKGGLLYCYKCNTPKQAIIKIGGKLIKPMCLCDCEIKALREKQEEQKKKERIDSVKRLKILAFPYGDLYHMNFNADDGTNEKITRIAKSYVDQFDSMLDKGKGLLFYGAVGTGKTFYAACIANALIENGNPCLFTNFSRIANALSGYKEDKQKYIDDMNKYDLLIIDDLFAERDTSYMYEIIHSVIDTRYRAKKPLIITTNLTSEQLKHPQSMKEYRIYSRLFEICLPVEIKGKDRRRKTLAEDYKSLAEVLNL